MADFRGDLRALINSYSKENQSHTPDFILAEFMDDCLRAFDTATVRREEWYGRESVGPSGYPSAEEVVWGGGDERG